jgi:hypothetical protein
MRGGRGGISGGGDWMSGYVMSRGRGMMRGEGGGVMRGGGDGWMSSRESGRS